MNNCENKKQRLWRVYFNLPMPPVTIRACEITDIEPERSGFFLIFKDENGEEIARFQADKIMGYTIVLE